MLPASLGVQVGIACAEAAVKLAIVVRPLIVPHICYVMSGTNRASIVLSNLYVMSNTDTHSLSLSCYALNAQYLLLVSRPLYAMPGTKIRLHCYAMRGTELWYAAALVLRDFRY